MIIKYRRRAILILLTAFALILLKFGLSIILGVFRDTLGNFYTFLNVVDAIVLFSLLPGVLLAVFLAPYWYGRSKGIPGGKIFSLLFHPFGLITLLSMEDQSVQTQDGKDQVG